MSRSASIKDVANHARVAVGTVSNVLNYPDRVSQRTKDRVLQAIEELGFVRNDAARQLRAGHSRTIGLIVLDVGNPFFTAVARAAEDAAALQGSAVLLGDSGHDAGRESDYIDLFQEQRVQGLLISPVGDVEDRLDQLRERGVPTVLVDRLADDASYSSVSVDDDEGGYLAARHLLDIGRRRLAFVGRPDVDPPVRGPPPGGASAPSRRCRTPHWKSWIPTGRRSWRAAAWATSWWSRSADKLPDGIFCANDLLALGVMQSLAMTHTLPDPRGHRPDRLRRHRLRRLRRRAAVLHPPAHGGPGSDGHRAAGRGARRPTQPRHRAVIFTPELVVRQSTAGAAV